MGSSLDEDTLQQVARITGGDYYRARDLPALQAIYEKLDQLEPKAKDSVFYRELYEWYTWPLALAFLLSILSGLFISGLFRQAVTVISGQRESYHVS